MIIDPNDHETNNGTFSLGTSDKQHNKPAENPDSKNKHNQETITGGSLQYYNSIHA